MPEIHAFRASCTSAADTPDLHFEYFATEPAAFAWSEDAVAEEHYGQIVVEAQRADGTWNPIASFVPFPPAAKLLLAQRRSSKEKARARRGRERRASE
jgi:hypothetical protein